MVCPIPNALHKGSHGAVISYWMPRLMTSSLEAIDRNELILLFTSSASEGLADRIDEVVSFPHRTYILERKTSKVSKNNQMCFCEQTYFLKRECMLQPLPGHEIKVLWS